ncbi:MAG: hypothetical protein INR68_02200 [Methylobacterium mesophilicum]|nr:hypothetical protein [Methylobacterium mesophilicum]
MTALLAQAFRRRALVQALMALPILAAFRSAPPPASADETVDVDGWILKRSDLA